MNETAAVAGGLRPPSNVRELTALVVAFGACLAASYGVSLAIDGLEAVPEHLRGYINGLPLGAVPTLYGAVANALRRASGANERPDLPSWFVTGAVAGAALFAWHWFATFLMKFTLDAAFGADPVAETAFAVETAASYNAMVMTALAAVYTGVLLNRLTRSGVIAALALAGFGFVALQLGVSYLLYPALFNELVGTTLSENSAAVVAGMVAGFLVIPLGIGLLAGIGAAWSAANRERSLGRLVSAARRLPLEDRESLTRDALGKLAERR